MTSNTVLRLLRTSRLEILSQLHLEEALFRSTGENWLVVNDGVAAPAIVLGISGKPSQLVYEERAKGMGVRLIKRFTGGGTVVVDENCIMTSVIVGGGRGEGAVACYPRQIMEWTHGLLFGGDGSSGRGRSGDDLRPSIVLRENDFTVGSRKVGGNAQAISGGRFLQHTSFLWDYEDALMGLLKVPEKQPVYRGHREHGGFVTRLKDCVGAGGVEERARFIDSIVENCVKKGGWSEVVEVEVGEGLEVLERYRESGGAHGVGRQVLLGSRYID